MYYYKSKKGNKVLCLEHPIEEDLRYSKSRSAWEPCTLGEYEQYVARKNAKMRIHFLERELARTDWVVIKIGEETDASKIAELRNKYADVIAQRKSWRAEINELERL